jgi:hypothetical protein
MTTNTTILDPQPTMINTALEQAEDHTDMSCLLLRWNPGSRFQLDTVDAD